MNMKKILVFVILLLGIILSGCDYDTLYTGIEKTDVIDIDDKLSSAGYYRDKYRLDFAGSVMFEITSHDGVTIIWQHYNASDSRIGTESTDSSIIFTETMSVGDHFYIAVYQNNQDWIELVHFSEYLPPLPPNSGWVTSSPESMVAMVCPRRNER